MGVNERVYLISLGCAKNLVDSEHVLGLLQAEGLDLAGSMQEADTVVINTCGFIRDAVEESIDTIFEVASLKRKGKLKRIVVAGCFVQRYGYKLREEIPEVDIWLGTGVFRRIAETLVKSDINGSGAFYICRPSYLADHSVPRIQTTPFFSSYIRIAEGCSHRCSYCLIPALRGRFRSRLPESVVEEAQEMADKGVKEVNIIAQDTTMYGRDLGELTCLEDLLEDLLAVKGILWIRLLYCHPEGISNRLLELIDSEEKICPYLDIPFQHINKGILKTMGRWSDEESPWELIERIRSCKRKIALRTTLMVGFPGESEEVFEELYDFVKTVRFDQLGTFVFNPEKGTRAARLRGSVDKKVALERRERIMALQAGISKKLNEEMLGYTVQVLIEGVSPETELLLTGRTAAMAPDTDSRVLINKGEGKQGEIMEVFVTEAHPYDLVGEIVG